MMSLQRRWSRTLTQLEYRELHGARMLFLGRGRRTIASKEAPVPWATAQPATPLEESHCFLFLHSNEAATFKDQPNKKTGFDLRALQSRDLSFWIAMNMSGWECSGDLSRLLGYEETQWGKGWRWFVCVCVPWALPCLLCLAMTRGSSSWNFIADLISLTTHWFQWAEGQQEHAVLSFFKKNTTPIKL